MIGILALQGAFLEHKMVLDQLQFKNCYVKTLEDFHPNLSGIILPGGESTTMMKLLKEAGLLLPLKEAFIQGLPVFGTCAGCILLAKTVESFPVEGFQTMDIVVKRNAYGRQLGSFREFSTYQNEDIELIFIRAPKILQVGREVTSLLEVQSDCVAARQGNQLVCTFHPELSQSLSFHRYFLKFVYSYMKTKTAN